MPVKMAPPPSVRPQQLVHLRDLEHRDHMSEPALRRATRAAWTISACTVVIGIAIYAWSIIDRLGPQPRAGLWVDVLAIVVLLANLFVYRYYRSARTPENVADLGASVLPPLMAMNAVLLTMILTWVFGLPAHLLFRRLFTG